MIEIKTVDFELYKEELEMARHILASDIRQNPGRPFTVNIYEIEGGAGSNQPVELGVYVWTNGQTMNGNMAAQLANKIALATTLANEFKYNGYIVD